MPVRTLERPTVNEPLSLNEPSWGVSPTRILFLLCIAMLFSPLLRGQTVLEYSSFVTGGGGTDQWDRMPVMFEDATGIYYVGITDQNGLQTTPGAYQSELRGENDIFVIKVDHTGQVVWSTYFGGEGSGSAGSEFDPFHKTDRAFLVEGDAIYVTALHEDVRALPEFNQVGDSPSGTSFLVGKFHAITGELEWGTAISDPGGNFFSFDIYVDNGKVYTAGLNYDGSLMYTTPDALESTPPVTGDVSYFTILDGGTGNVDYASFYNNGSNESNRILQIAATGNILALAGVDEGDSRNTTVDAFSPLAGGGRRDQGFLTYFDLTTRQIVYDTYTTDYDFGARVGSINDLRTDGTRFYCLQFIYSSNGPDFVIDPPYTASSLFNTEEIGWMQVWNIDGTLESSFNILQNDFSFDDPWPYLTMDVPNNRYFIHGYAEGAQFPSVNSLIPHEPLGAGGFILEFEMSSNDLVFSQLFSRDGGVSTPYFGVLDVEIGPDGDLYLIVEDDRRNMNFDTFITPDALFPIGDVNASGNLLLRLDSNRKLKYGSYMFHYTDDYDYTNRQAQINILGDGVVEIYGVVITNFLINAVPLTQDAQYAHNGGLGLDYVYSRLNLCPDGTENTIDATQEVCINGLAQVIEGNAVTMIEYDDFTYKDLTVEQTQNVPWVYQWQVSFNNTDWLDLPGASERDFLPPPTSVEVYYRRLSRPYACTCAFDTSNVHILTVNGDIAPTLMEGETAFCPSTDIIIGNTATGGTNGTYTYSWGPVDFLSDPAIAQPTFNGPEGGTYVVTVTDDGNNCQFAESWQVDVVEADAGEPASFCVSDGGVLIGTTVSVDPNRSYAWTSLSGDPITSLNNPAVAQPIALPSQTTEYQLAVTINQIDALGNAVSCISTDQVIVGVSDPVANAGPDFAVCLGDDNILGGEAAQPGFSYGWAPGLYINNQNIAQPTFMSSLCPTEDGILATENPLRYTLTKIEDATGCIDVDTVFVSVLQLDLFNNFNCTPVTIGERKKECGLNLPGVTFNWSLVSGDANSLNGVDVSAEMIEVDPVSTSVYQLEVCLDGTCCSDLVTVTPDCGVNCSIFVDTQSEILCPVGGQFGTEIFATGEVDGIDINNLSPSLTFEWVPTTGLADPNSTRTAVNALVSDETYMFNVRDQNGNIICSDNAIVYASVVASPIVNLQPQVSTCFSQPVNIGLPAVAGWAYSWSPVDGLSDPNIANPLATVAVNTTYTVVVIDQVTGCRYQAEVEVVIGGPEIDAGPDRNFCENAIITLGTPALPNYSYSWTPTIGLNNANTAQPVDTIFASVTYMLEVTDLTTGCVATDEVTYTLSTPPTYEAPDVSICEGSSLQIGLPEQTGYSYFWIPNTGLSASNVAQPIASPTTTTTYNVIVSDGNPGCFASDQVVATVVPSTFSLELTDIMACPETTANLGVPDQGGAYSWSPTTGLSDSLISNPTVTVGNAPVTYTLTWETSDGCTLVDKQTITPFDVSTLSFTMTHTICEGETIQIGPDNAETGINYSWASILGDDASTLSSTAIHNPVATPTQTTIYQLTYTSSAGCVQTKDVIVTVSPYPTIELGDDDAICADVTLPMSVSGEVGGADYLWSTGETTETIVVSPQTSAATYMVTVSLGDCQVTDEVVFSPPFDYNAGEDQLYCPGAPVTIGPAADPGLNYNWSISSGPGPLPGTTNTAQIDVSPTGTTTYLLTVDDGAGCSQTDEVTLTLPTPPSFDLGAGQTICTNQCVRIGVEPVIGLTYNWVPTTGITPPTTRSYVTACPTADITYELEVTVAATGCTYTDDIAITVLPDVLFEPNAGLDALICQEQSLTLGVPDASGGSQTYNWSIVSGPGPLPAVITTAEIDVTPTATTTYRLTVGNGGTCTGMDDVTVTVLANPPAVDLGSDQTVCINGCIVIGVPAQTSTSYSWSPTTGISDPTQSQVTACPTVDTEYILVATNNLTGCTLSDEILLTIGTDPAPVAVAGDDVAICTGETTQLGAASTSGLVYTWAPTTNLLGAAQADPVFIGTTPGTYTYTLTVLDQATNCVSMTDTVVVTVNALPSISIARPAPFCSGGEVTLNLTVTNADPADLTFSWTPAGLFNDPTAEDPSITNLIETTVVSVAVTNTNTGCVNNASTQVILSDVSLEVDLGLDREVCLDEEVTLGINSITTNSGPGGETYSESFETNLGGWSQNTLDAFDWTRNSGATPTDRTGPGGALDGNFYLYIEVDGPASNQAATITSPVINLPASITTMSFEYHMYSQLVRSIGSLTLEISDDSGTSWNQLFRLTRSQGNTWRRAVVDISAFAGSAVNIRFTGTKGPSIDAFWNSRGDIAIDDIRFSANLSPMYAYSWTSADQGSTAFSTEAPYFVSGRTSTMPVINTSSLDYDRTYQLMLTDNVTGCIAKDQVDVTVTAPMAIINAGPSKILCSVTEYTMEALNPGETPIVGTWSQLSGPTTAVFSDVNDSTAVVSGLSLGTYEFQWTISGSCNDGSDVVLIEVNQAPSLVINDVCSPGFGDLTAAAVTEGSVLNGASLSYWLDTAATVQIPDPTMVLDGRYYIRALNSATACKAILPVDVYIIPEVIVASPTTICSSQLIDLTQDASITPASFGGVWSSSGNGDFTTGTAFGTATTYVPSPDDVNAGQVTLTLTADPVGPCPINQASVTFTILRVDCGTFPWGGN